MEAHIQHDVDAAPAPLEFLRTDFIHPDNRKLIEQDERRWRLLTRFERFKFSWRAWLLSRRLQREGWNKKLIERDTIKRAFRRARAAHAATTYINADAKADAQVRIAAMAERGKQLTAELNDLRPVFLMYRHYAGWLDYEAKHRKELAQAKKRDDKRKRDMESEAGDLARIIRDVWRKTPGCHYTYKDDHGKEVTKVPSLPIVEMLPDAHYFHLGASKRTLFGSRWLLPNGVEIKRLQEPDVLEQLRAGTKRQVDTIWTDQNQLLIRVSRLDSPDALPREVLWRDAMKYYPKARRERHPYSIGVSEGKRFQWLDLASEPHILVAGMSQSGKSNLVNGFVATEASTHSPDEWRVVLIDQKGGIEFTHWSELPHLLGEMVKTTDGVKPMLTTIVDIMRQRMALLEKAKAKDLDTYNRRVDVEYRMARISIIVDEMNTFVGLGKLTDDIQNLIMMLVSQGRVVGMHVIQSTQHPEVRVIPGRIKTNVGVRLSGRMPTVSASMIVLDNPDAANLPEVAGRFAASIGMRRMIVQVPRIFDEDIAGVVSSCQLAYPDVSDKLAETREAPQVKVWDEDRAIRACLEFLDGHLGAQKLHKMLGNESPGERHLQRLVNGFIERVQHAAAITIDGARYDLKRKGKAYWLIPYSDESDKTTLPVEPAEESEQASEPVIFESEAAAD